MPEPVRSDQKYLPGLDGLRALAVAAVVAYHLGYGWAQGGLLGVGVFFTLSGYLITDILVGQWAARGRIRLGDFWLRRARRLLPALFVMLAVVTVWVNVFARSFLPGFRGNVVASVFYASNWWYIDQHSSYYARFAPPTPLDHLWSLAVEEQFYLIWPWVVLLLVWLAALAHRWGRGRQARAGQAPAAGPAAGSYLTSRDRVGLAGATLVLATVSAILMAMLYHPGYDPTRVYEGTDTRAFGLLIGAAVAMVWPTRGARGPGAAARRTVRTGTRRLLDAVGIVGLAVIVLLVWRTNQYSPFMFTGGLELLSVATAAVVIAAVTPGSLLGRALGCGPLRWVGVRSYGIYLWHYPLILLTAAAGTADEPASLGRAVAVVAGTVAVAAVSWRVVEEPIRRGVRPRLIPAPRTSEPAAAAGGASDAHAAGEAASGGPWRRWQRPRALRSPVAVGALCVFAAALVASGVTVSTRLISSAAPSQARLGSATAQVAVGDITPSASADATSPSSSADPARGPSAPGKQATSGERGPAAAHATNSASPNAPQAVGPAAVVPALPTPPPRTSCSEVVHIGDSTSDGLVSADYEPNPNDRIPARYADVGVKKSIMKVVGATSVVESLPGTPNAYDMASQVIRSGYHGCWVLALGTNDTADVAVGSEVSRLQRIQKMMSVIGNQPVMWVEVISLLSSGPYAEQNMELWNQALQQALPDYPNMRIYNWPAVAQQSWFINDGIHYTSIGYAHRATAIADALAVAFPAGG